MKKLFVLSLSMILLMGQFPAIQVKAGSGQSIVSQQNTMFSQYLENHNRSFKGKIPSTTIVSGSSSANKFILKSAVNLPEKYDLRDFNRITAVKDQGTIGTCWSFAAIASLESTLLSSTGIVNDFSEINPVVYSGFDIGPNDGGNADMMAAYLSRWSGPIDEKSQPYPNPPVPSNISTSVIPGSKAQVHVQDMYYLPERNSYTDNSSIKEHVMKYGAVQASISYQSDYYNKLTWSYYNNNSNSILNHDINIVGWDDNYPSSKFAIVPPGNGAFICKNSWGTTFGDRGYFYVSYYDAKLGTDKSVVFTGEPTNNYYNIYQYDTLGATGAFLLNSEAWFSNIFLPDVSKNEKLAAVSFYTLEPNLSYEIYLEKDYDSNGFSKLSRVKSGTIAEAGYHTIKLDSTVSINNTKKYAVAVRLVNSSEGQVSMAVERPIDGYSSKASGNQGESYYSFNGQTWNDIATVQSNTNCCLKAFTASGLMGDADNNDVVDIKDLAAVAQDYNFKRTNKYWNAIRDMNNDAIIDIYDLTTVSKNIK